MVTPEPAFVTWGNPSSYPTSCGHLFFTKVSPLQLCKPQFSPGFPIFSFSFSSGPDARASHSLMHTHSFSSTSLALLPLFPLCPALTTCREILSRASSPKATGNCPVKLHSLAAPSSTLNEKQCRNWWGLKDFLKINSLSVSGSHRRWVWGFSAMLSNRDGEKCVVISGHSTEEAVMILRWEDFILRDK